MKIIKSNTYNVISNEPFEIPKPLEFEFYYGNTLLAVYKIGEDDRVDYSFNPESGGKMLTSTNRPLELRDIYFLFSSRVFPDHMPFTQGELKRFGVEEYNPYEIIRKTHGIMNGDQYWFKFPGEELTYKKAAELFGDYFNPDKKKNDSEKKTEPENEELPETIFSLDSIMNQKSNEFTSINDVNSILSQNALDFQSLKNAVNK